MVPDTADRAFALIEEARRIYPNLGCNFRHDGAAAYWMWTELLSWVYGARENIGTRVYVPCGRPGMPYRLKEIGRDPRILTWFTRDLIRA
jgi:hypothetical protein